MTETEALEARLRENMTTAYRLANDKNLAAGEVFQALVVVKLSVDAILRHLGKLTEKHEADHALYVENVGREYQARIKAERRLSELEQALVDLHESLFIAAENRANRPPSEETLRRMAAFAKAAVTGSVRVPAVATEEEADGE